MFGDHSNNKVKSRPSNNSHQRQAGGGVEAGGLTGSRGGPELAGLV
jgi:hypothetical protein